MIDHTASANEPFRPRREKHKACSCTGNAASIPALDKSRQMCDIICAGILLWEVTYVHTPISCLSCHPRASNLTESAPVPPTDPSPADLTQGEGTKATLFRFFRRFSAAANRPQGRLSIASCLLMGGIASPIEILYPLFSLFSHDLFQQALHAP